MLGSLASTCRLLRMATCRTPPTATGVIRGGTSAANAIANPLRRAYHDNVIDHYEKPRNVGSLDKQSKFVGSGLVGAPCINDTI